MVEVYARPLSERFLSSRWSAAYLFRCCWYVALIVPPIYIAYSTGDFWRRENTYQEQPLCVFTKQIIMIGSDASGARVIQYSTIERFNYLIGYENVKQPTIKSWYTDTNLDTKPDRWNINLVFPLSSTDSSIVHMDAFLFFHVTYGDHINLDMDAMVQASSPGGVAGNKWTVVGDLELFQRNPLPRGGSGTRNIYQYPIVNDSTIKVIEDIDLTNLMLLNEARNETLHLNSRQVWQSSGSSSFNVSFDLSVPMTRVSYIPSAGETIKFAYIQWLAMFWLVYFGLKFIREFVYVQNVVDTMRVKDGTPLGKLHQF